MPIYHVYVPYISYDVFEVDDAKTEAEALELALVGDYPVVAEATDKALVQEEAWRVVEQTTKPAK